MYKKEKEVFNQRIYQTLVEPWVDARKKAGITQKKLAELSGIPQEAIPYSRCFESSN